MVGGYFTRKFHILILWLLCGFKGSFREAEEKHYRRDYIIGFLFTFIIGYLISLFY